MGGGIGRDMSTEGEDRPGFRVEGNVKLRSFIQCPSKEPSNSASATTVYIPRAHGFIRDDRRSG